ncbi:uncharacterized protein LOC143342069 [Colletes latitarsis]|uniref:uncharacterized protein LOC143342069 n=1 Tax=Colletes latitarsis TaxID=2605962 RepID=UPI00403656EB
MQKFLCIFGVCVITSFAATLPEKNDGVLGKIKAGLEYATNYLETAKDIADLVARSLGRKQKEKLGEDYVPKQKGSFVPSNIMSAFFRLVGLDSQKVTAIAVNSVIFLAQMASKIVPNLFSSLFGLKPPKENIARELDDEDETSWNPANIIMDSKNERIQKLIEQAHDDSLANQLIERVDGTDSACIRLLVCKTSPVIRAAQSFLKNKTGSKYRRMTSWLPSRDEFEENSDQCENTHTDCSLFA